MSYFRESVTSYELVSVSFLCGGRRKGRFLQLLVPCDHFSEPEALPAENLDPRALSDRTLWRGFQEGGC